MSLNGHYLCFKPEARQPCVDWHKFGTTVPTKLCPNQTKSNDSCLKLVIRRNIVHQAENLPQQRMLWGSNLLREKRITLNLAGNRTCGSNSSNIIPVGFYVCSFGFLFVFVFVCRFFASSSTETSTPTTVSPGGVLHQAGRPTRGC